MQNNLLHKGEGYIKLPLPFVYSTIGKDEKSMLYKKKLPLLLFLIPGLLLMMIFLYEPFLENIINSFYDMKSVVKMPGQEWTFIGIKNYKKLFVDPKIRIAMFNSFKMMGMAVIFQVGIAFILAILVSLLKRGQQVFRIVFFFPIVISASAIGLLFKLFYNYNGGMLNQILHAIDKGPINWLAPTTAFLMVSIPIIWSYIGFYFVIILTGLSSISDDIYEAASIDGCSRWKQVYYITIPLTRSVMCTCITLAVTGSLKVFDLPWVIVPKGAPQGVTHLLGTYMYEQTFAISNIDYGSTIAFVIVIFGVIVSKLVTKILKPTENL
jgi:raffinose/stachyose/melibiose transport system permease protein